MAEWQERLVGHFERQDARALIRDEADKVTPCDGLDPSAIKPYLRELELIDLANRFLVFQKTARGSLLRIGLAWFAQNGANPDWHEFRTHIMESFVSSDANDALQAELRTCTRRPGESLLSYNRRFGELADDAYPGDRNIEQVANLVRQYAQGLKDVKLAEKIIVPAKPQTLQQAFDRIAATERKVDNMLWLGYEPMEVDALEAARYTPQVQYLEKEVRQLKSQFGKLDSKVDAILARLPAPSRQPHQGTRTSKDDRTCHYCGIRGHLQRDCRKKKREDATRAGGRQVAASSS